jgi:hypothetical protein
MNEDVAFRTKKRLSLAGIDVICINWAVFCLYNVPAVCDVLPARIRALRSKDQGWQNVA